MRRYTIAFAVLLSAWLYAGLAGIDFGHHWDEERITASVAASLRSGVMLPGWYNYPSFCYQLGLVVAAPDVIEVVFGASSTAEMAEAIAASAGFVEGAPYLLRLRMLFLLLSSLSTLWVFLLVLRWRDAVEALTAAGLFLTSWEFAYHARWVAPDALLAMAVALGMLLMHMLLDQPRIRYALAAAAVAGFAAGIKYQGAILLLPFAIALLWRAPKTSKEHRLRFILLGAGMFAATFLITTPGALLDPFRFVGDVVVEMRHYAEGHWGHSITPGVEHAVVMLRWLVVDALAPWPAASLLVAVAAVLGAVVLIREQKRFALWYLLIPVAYVAYMSFQQVMIVRNLLLLLPFLAVLAARGFEAAAAFMHRPVLRSALRILPFLVVVASLVWQIDSGEALRHRRDRDVVLETRAWLDHRADRHIRFSPALAERIPSPSISTQVFDDGDTLLLFATSEIDSLMLLPANLRIYQSVSGLPDVNVTAYPDWAGEEKVLAIPVAVARKHRVFDSLLIH